MSGKNCILAIDQGTTGSTAMVVEVLDTKELRVVERSTVDFPQIYPQAGWVEHDLESIWESCEKAVSKALDLANKNHGIRQEDIQCLGITNQRETLCVFEKSTAKPLRNAIVWQCRRSTEICKDMKAAGLEKTFREKTGLVLDPYFSGTKLRWILENEPALAEKIHSGEALIGTIDTYLIYRLTGGLSHVTEPSNASRTLLFNVKAGEFDSELTKELGLKNHNCLPVIKDSAGDFGLTKGLSFLRDGIQISGVLGDQQAALAGQACFEKGQSKCTYGTGAFLLANLGSDFNLSTAGLLTTVAWRLKGKLSYAFEGSSFIAGAAIQFLRDQLEFLKNAADSESMSEGVVASPEVYFVPALAGLGAPYWNPEARGSFLGLTRGTTKAQLVRAALEGMAFQVGDLISSIEKDGVKVSELRVDGGACQNSLLLQFQANITDKVIARPVNLETTAFGAAMFAAIGSGIYESLEELKSVAKIESKFSPSDSFDKKTVNNGWKRAVKAVEVFAGNSE